MRLLNPSRLVERVMGIEPTPSAWKAEVLPLNYTRLNHRCRTARFEGCPEPSAAATSRGHLVEGGGFEPPKAEPSDLQSDPFDRSGTPPSNRARQSSLPPHHGQPQFGTAKAPGAKPPARSVLSRPPHIRPPRAATRPNPAADVVKFRAYRQDPHPCVPVAPPSKPLRYCHDGRYDLWQRIRRPRHRRLSR
jgi:hypothetical protein